MEVMLLDSLEWFQEQRHWEDWLRKHEVEDSPQRKALLHKYGAEGPSGLNKLGVLCYTSKLVYKIQWVR